MKNKIDNLPEIDPNSTLEYVDREALKDSGWQKYYHSEETDERAEGLQMIMVAHYYRSKESFRGKHPKFKIFVQHWIAANGDRYDKDVITFLNHRFGTLKGKQMIAPHASYWEKNWENGPYFKYVYQPG